MADFNQIVSDVVAITKRPDLVAETQIAVKSATLQLHRSDFYFKDLVEATIQYDTPNYLQDIQYKQLFPRSRALSYLRKYNPNLNTDFSTCLFDVNGMGPEFEIISPDQIFDSYRVQRTNVVYLAGDTLKVRSSTQDQYAVIGVFLSPDVSSAENYTSWIADEYPYAIVYLAAANIFGTTLNNPSKQNANANLAQIELQALRASNITAKGY